MSIFNEKNNKGAHHKDKHNERKPIDSVKEVINALPERLIRSQVAIDQASIPPNSAPRCESERHTIFSF